MAQDPDAHLLPHLRRACYEEPLPLELLGAEVEDATYVRQRSTAAVDLLRDGADVFEVATGMLEPDTRFATHGHVLLLRVALADA